MDISTDDNNYDNYDNNFDNDYDGNNDYDDIEFQLNMGLPTSRSAESPDIPRLFERQDASLSELLLREQLDRELDEYHSSVNIKY